MTSRLPSKHRRAALLVFHGIGEQNPYQPLDAFVRGLRSVLQLKAGSLEHVLLWRDDKAVTAVRLKLDLPSISDGTTELDVSEFYWAPMVQNGITVRQVLSWLFRTGVSPLFHWADQPGLLRPKDITFWRQTWLFVKTLARSLVLLALVAGLVGPFVYVGVTQDGIIGKLKDDVWPSLKAVLTSWEFLVTVVLVFLAGCMLLSTRDLFKGSHNAKRALTAKESRWWGSATLVTGAAALAGAVGLLLTTDVPTLIGNVWAALIAADLVFPLLTLGLTSLLAWPLVRVVGDIPLYVTQNERSAYYKTRREILEESAKRVKALLMDDQYETVYLAGHSLGSVIAYDTINCMAREVRSGHPAKSDERLTAARYKKLRGLLTFGSPLDKVYYFFRTRVKDDEEIRAQLESSLHGFRVKRSGRSYGECKIDYKVPVPRPFTWLNVYNLLDPIGAHLDYYIVQKQVCLPHWKPWKSHTRYWNDHRNFYPLVATWLGLQLPMQTTPLTLTTLINAIPGAARKVRNSVESFLRP